MLQEKYMTWSNESTVSLVLRSFSRTRPRHPWPGPWFSIYLNIPSDVSCCFPGWCHSPRFVASQRPSVQPPANSIYRSSQRFHQSRGEKEGVAYCCLLSYYPCVVQACNMRHPMSRLRVVFRVLAPNAKIINYYT